MISVINRGKLDQPVQEEFDHLVTKLRGLLSQSFDEDGELIVADPNFAIVPVGALLPFAGTTAPSGYLVCDGAQVSRASYASLFGVIGTTYGAGDGSTTFNLPDLRQRFPLGKAAAGTGATLGAKGGAIDHDHGLVATTSIDGAHGHTVNAHGHSVGAHGHTFSGTVAPIASHGPVTVNFGGDVLVADYTHDHTFSGTTANGGNGTTGDTSPGTNSAGAHGHSVSGVSTAANPPFLTVNYLIYSGVGA